MYRRYDMPDKGNPILAYLRKSNSPITLIICTLAVVIFFLILSLPNTPIFENLAYYSPIAVHQFWTFITWPFAVLTSPIGLVFSVLWFFNFASSLERSWNRGTFVSFLTGSIVIPSISLFFGSKLFGPSTLFSLWTLGAIVTVGWVAVNKFESICFWGITIPAKVIGIIAAVMVWYECGASSGRPLLGLFGLTGCAFAYYFASSGKYAYEGYRRKKTSTLESRFQPRGAAAKKISLNPFKAWKEKKERDKLKEMFRRSGFKDE